MQAAQAFTDQLTDPETLDTPLGRAAQLTAGLAGMVAVPLVAWSEYTLGTTGKHLAVCSQSDGQSGHAAQQISTFGS